ncbi:gibberellin 2-beta-dioxygenase 1 [Heracleum sosnowskyi]|uniref:Gibberellin 2-beta-dioxygenase 1 n=1 Tax=Heracleum sosnowskyi TaxID=360622 RepID=A0AAD8GV89_9APIA|nr:gibberellin 2-beta-dioxygenase 1 [Heracleum sosnowskyi]
MSSSTTSQEQDHYHYALPAAPPPTPASQSHISTSSPAIDNLSQLFSRLPPTLSLSLPKRRPSSLSPPIISLPDLSLRFSRAFETGFFQLSGHNIPSQLAKLAETDSLSLFNLPLEKKHHHFPQNWPLGYEDDNDEEHVSKTSESFCFDSSCYGELDELKLTSLREFTQEMEKVGLEIIEALSCALGFDNPTRDDPTRICSLMWVSEEAPGSKQVMSGKMYPYVVGLQYQLKGQKSMMLADSGWVSVPTQVESVLVTLGDIAQVWSNGKLKKVRGRPIPSLEEGSNSAKCISMTLLLTLPLDSTVSTLIPKSIESQSDEDDDDDDDDRDGNEDIAKTEKLFKSFSFEDYAWRMYYEQHVLKDPLDRYRA